MWVIKVLGKLLQTSTRAIRNENAQLNTQQKEKKVMPIHFKSLQTYLISASNSKILGTCSIDFENYSISITLIFQLFSVLRNSEPQIA